MHFSKEEGLFSNGAVPFPRLGVLSNTTLISVIYIFFVCRVNCFLRQESPFLVVSLHLVV